MLSTHTFIVSALLGELYLFQHADRIPEDFEHRYQGQQQHIQVLALNQTSPSRDELELAYYGRDFLRLPFARRPVVEEPLRARYLWCMHCLRTASTLPPPPPLSVASLSSIERASQDTWEAQKNRAESRIDEYKLGGRSNENFLVDTLKAAFHTSFPVSCF